MRGILTDSQRDTLRYVVRETQSRDDKWARARGSGERVTLASLYRRGLLDRRAWRGNDGDADAAYEYQLSKRMREFK